MFKILFYASYILIAGLIFALYKFPFTQTYSRWKMGDSPGLLILIISFFLILQKRKLIKQLKKRRSYSGLVVIISALLFYLAARRGDLSAPMTLSSIILFYGLIFYLYGKDVARQVSFPIFFLIFAVQLGFTEAIISVKLRIFSTVVSTAIVNALGISVQRVGTYVYTPDVQYDIASPCSGLNSLVSLTALSFVFAYLTQKKLWRRAVIVVMAVPLALFSNTSRIVGLTLAARGFGAKFALTAFHDWSGYFTFGFGLICLFGIGHVLGKIPAKAKGAEAQRHKGTEAKRKKELTAHSPQKIENKQKKTEKRRVLPHLAVIIGLLGLTLIGAKTIEQIRYFSKGLNFDSIPLEIGEWNGEDILANEKEITHLPKDTEHFKRTYTKGETKIFVAIVQSKSDRHSIHPPEACFPAQGWSIGTPTPFKVDVGGGKVITASKFQTSFGEYKEIIVYWYQTEKLMTTKFPVIPLVTAKDLILYGRNDRWALIRLSSPVGESVEEIEERMKDFIRDLWKYVQYD